MNNFAYLAVNCSNPDCRQVMLLQYLGPHSRFVGYVVSGPETFGATCPACDGSDFYGRSQVGMVLGPEPPPDFVQHPLFPPIENL